jgi:uncharacterized protein (DUF1015 family)
LRPRADLAGKIPSLPYDVLDTREARRVAEHDPYTFLHVVKPEIDLPPDVDPFDDRVYRTGRRNFDRMIEQGWLVRDPRPAYYVYRLEHGDHVQTGIAGLASLDDYREGRIKKHELTRPDKERDRARHMEAVSANVGPVLAAYRRVPELSAVVTAVVSPAPAVDFTAPDGVRHELWVVDDPASVQRIEGLFSRVHASYIADGHHRAAAAARVAAQRAGAAGGGDGRAPHEWFLTVHFPAHQLRILDYNRVVRDLNGLDPETFLERVRQAGFDVKHDHRVRRAPHRRSFGMYLAGRWHLLTTKVEPEQGDPVRALDVQILTDQVLEPILGIGDIRTDPRIDFVGGVRGMGELERRVDSGDSAVAFAVYPTTIDEVMKIADAGGVMPPKSTWFEPKLRSGMVVHPLDDGTID